MMQHQYTVVTRTYAEALFAGARRLGIVQRALEEAKVLGRILVQTPQLATFLDHPRLAREVKLATIERVFRTRVSPLMLNLLRTLVIRRRTSHLGEILALFQELGEQAEGIFQATVSAAYELSFQDKLKLKAGLERYTRCRLKLDYQVEAGLIGGIVFRFRDVLVDSSLRGGLEALGRQLAATALGT